MGISFSNIGTVGREQLITSGSNGEPNWSYIPSKGKSTRTQTEFVSEIKKLAQKAANATDKTEQDAISRQLLQLRAEYLSEVAPDRKQLYQQAKSAMKNQNANPKCKGIGELTLLDFWNRQREKSESCGQADCTGRRRNIKIHYFNIRWLWCSNSESGRECIVKYRCRLGIRNDSGRTYKKDEFYSIYWKEYNAVKNGMNSELKELPDYLEKRPVFEAKA